MAKEAKFSDSRGKHIVKALTCYTHSFGEIPYLSEWVQGSGYKGVVSEIQKNIKDRSFQIVHAPDTCKDLAVYIPPMNLDSGYKATLFPVFNVMLGKKNDTQHRPVCVVEKVPLMGDDVFKFDGAGDYQGICWEGDPARVAYVKKLMQLFERKTRKTDGVAGIDAIRLRKRVKNFSHKDAAEAEKMLKKHKFNEATIEMRSGYMLNHDDFVLEYAINNAQRDRDNTQSKSRTGFGMAYKFHDDRFEGNPSLVSISVQSLGNLALTPQSLSFIDELSSLF